MGERGCYIVAGCYSHVLYGYFVSHDQTVFKVTPLFIYKAHSACIRVLSAQSNFLLSGSDDESVKIYNLDKKKEVGTLLHHNGSIGKIEFVPNENKKSNWVITSGEDGKVILWRKKDWTALLEIQAHQEAATYHYSPAISVHPSGRLCLSIGAQCELKMWDLTNGKCAFRKKLPKSKRSVPYLFQGQKNSKGRELPVHISWSPSGTHYAILYPSHLIIIDSTSGEITNQFEDEQLLLHFIYINDSIIALSGEGGRVSFYDIPSKKKLLTLKAHPLRIKGMSLVAYKDLITECTEDGNLPFLFTGSSNGDLKLWDLQKLLKESPEILANPNPPAEGVEIQPCCTIATKDRVVAITTSITSAFSDKRTREEYEDGLTSVDVDDNKEIYEEEQDEEEEAPPPPKKQKTKSKKKAKVVVSFE